MVQPLSSVFWIDCQYIRPQFATAYIVKSANYAAIIETGTKYNLEIILNKLDELQIKKENVLYVIPTHVHLDHAACAGFLLQELPNAKIVAHPRGKKHFIDPSRLKESTIEVYGEEIFKKLYDDILPIAEERVLISEHSMKLELAEETLEFYHCEGHASHHLAVFLRSSKILFTGDTFGIAYPELQGGDEIFVFPSATPVDFHAEKAIESIDLFLQLKPKAVALTHYGIYSDIEAMANELKTDLELFDKWVQEETNESDNSIRQKKIEKKLTAYFREKLIKKDLATEKIKLLENDILLNAMGLSIAAERLVKKRDNH